MFPEKIHYDIAKELHKATYPEADVTMIKRILTIHFNNHQKKKFDSVTEAYFELYSQNWVVELGKMLNMESFVEVYNLIKFDSYYKSINETIGRIDRIE